jgi:DNA primase
MGGIIPKTLVEDIRARCDVVEVIGAYLQLKRAGNTFRALCPFHKEKTPSFHVNPQRQIFHCFGCGEGGDVFQFVMKYENVDFGAAARILAQRAGVRLEFEESGRERQPGGIEKDALLRIHEDVAQFYHRCLLDETHGAAARKYLAGRELSLENAQDFLIGYAPDRWDSLLLWAEKKKVSVKLLEAAGLVVAKDGGGYYDRFRNRLMFSIRDELGRVVAFSGRVMNPEEKTAKYVNSPETMLFKKGRLLFALDRARRAIADERRAILCEGQIDCIRCHLAGFTNVVASQGTALTEDHARLLKRYADEVLIVLDADNAGQNAALRAAEVLLAAGLSIRIAALPPGDDPDSLIRKQGRAAFERVLAGAVGALDFQAGLMRARGELASEAGKNRSARAMLELIARAPTAVQRDLLLHQAAELLQVSEEALRQDARRQVRAPVRVTEAPPPAKPVAHPPDEVTLLELLVQHPDVAAEIVKYLPPELLTDADCRALYQQLRAAPEAFSAAVTAMGAEGQRLAAQIQMTPTRVMGGEFTPQQAARDLVLAIARAALERQRAAKQQQRATATGAASDQLTQEISQLTLDLKNLRQGWAKAEMILATFAG